MVQHAELGILLRAAYPHFPEHFAGLRTWSYVRPEARVIGNDAAGAAATAGVLRRFLEIGTRDQLVGVVGIVAVRPDLQSQGVGSELMSHVARLLAKLNVPYGLLMCGERHVGFYRRAGWHQLTSRRAVYSADDTGEAMPFVDEVVTTAMVLPVAAGVDDWPDGELRWHGASV